MYYSIVGDRLPGLKIEAPDFSVRLHVGGIVIGHISAKKMPSPIPSALNSGYWETTYLLQRLQNMPGLKEPCIFVGNARIEAAFRGMGYGLKMSEYMYEQIAQRYPGLRRAAIVARARVEALLNAGSYALDLGGVGWRGNKPSLSLLISS